MDSFVKSEIESEIAVANAQRQIAQNPAAEPVVTILWSESPHLKDGQQMPLHEAEAVFNELDSARRMNGAAGYTGHWYDKTKFRIDFTMQGQPDSYEGRQDFGDGDGSLIQHIRGYHEYYAQDESWKNHVLHHEGPEAWEADKAQRDTLLHEFIPYMELHCNLAAMEQEARRPLRSGETLTPEQTAYFNAVLDYVKECRPLLNQGQYHLPEPPQLADFDQSLQDYKKQIEAELEQEAAASGLTVEEYVASDYEAPAQPTFHLPSAARPGGGATSATVPMRTCRQMGFRWTGRITSLSTPRRWTRTPHWTRFTAASTWNIPPITRDIPSQWGILWCSGRMGNRPPTMWTREPTTGRCRSSSPSRKAAHARRVHDRRTNPDATGPFLSDRQEREQMEAAGYGFHHQSDDGRYLIMANGTRAFAIPAQQESHIKTAEMSTEQNYNMIDGMMNNAPSMEELEARAKAGEQISLWMWPRQPRRRPKAQAAPAPGAETEKTVHPGAAQSRQGGTAEETAAAGESTGIGGVTP